jgi:glucose-6-phosphate isomerase
VPVPPLRERPAYAALAEYHAKIEGRHLRELFAEDSTRGERINVSENRPVLHVALRTAVPGTEGLGGRTWRPTGQCSSAWSGWAGWGLTSCGG